ncbi:MAG: hypothetical protein QNJ09_05600 [Paracoccaceae bacterium]|nr:hypothetical protein [Paracoccaceae bacterium]
MKSKPSTTNLFLKSALLISVCATPALTQGADSDSEVIGILPDPVAVTDYSPEIEAEVEAEFAGDEAIDIDRVNEYLAAAELADEAAAGEIPGPATYNTEIGPDGEIIVERVAVEEAMDTIEQVDEDQIDAELEYELEQAELEIQRLEVQLKLIKLMIRIEELKSQQERNELIEEVLIKTNPKAFQMLKATE